MPPLRTSATAADPKLREKMLEPVPMRGPCHVEEAAYAVLFLASDEASYITGTGRVEYVSPDAAELPDACERDRKDPREHVMPPSGFRTLVALDSAYLERDGRNTKAQKGSGRNTVRLSDSRS